MEGYKLNNKEELIKAIKQKGLDVKVDFEDNSNTREYLGGKEVKRVSEFIDIYKGHRIGYFEQGIETWELICNVKDNEKVLKQFGILDLTKEYWPRY